jgi:uncharacterized glyoxalase superfamily protein PhnB
MAIRGARPSDGTVTPHLLVRGGAAAADFYKRAFGARELYRSPLPGGVGLHLKLRIENTFVWVTDETPPTMDDPGHMAVKLGSPQSLCGTSVVLELCVQDADALFERAVAAGATPTLPMSDAFWGDRYGWVTDPFGHIWAITAVQEELTPEQIAERLASIAE